MIFSCAQFEGKWKLSYWFQLRRDHSAQLPLGKVSPGTVHHVGGSQVQEQQCTFHCGHETVDQVYTPRGFGGGREGGVNGGRPVSLHVFGGLQEAIRSSFSWDAVCVRIMCAYKNRHMTSSPRTLQTDVLE